MWIAAMLVAVSSAQDATPQLNSQLYRPPTDSEATLWAEDSHAAPDGYIAARSFFQYANAPLRMRDGTGEVDTLVGDVAELDLMGAITYKSVRFGVHAPMILLSSSPYETNMAGIGDLALDLKGTLVDRSTAPVGVAVMGRLFLPTSNVDASLGERSTGWELTAVVDKRFEDVLVTANVGTRDVPRTEWGDAVWNDPFFARLGAGWFITEDVGLSGDFSAQTNWASGRNPAGTAVEVMPGGFARILPDIVLRGGVGAGLSQAPGAARFRAIAGLSWEPDPNPDFDLDGVVDRDDFCKNEAEDPDGFADWDGCPDPSTTVRVDMTDLAGKDVDSAVVQLSGPEKHTLPAGEEYLTVHPGTYEMIVMADGYEPVTTEIEVPAEPSYVLRHALVAKQGTLRVWAVDADGTPVPATYTISGGDSVAADGEPQVVGAGEHAVVVSAAGFEAVAVALNVAHGEGREYSAVLQPSGKVATVSLGSDRIVVGDKIFFDLNKASIQSNSHALLDEVAALLLTHPEVQQVTIEGHTDSQGPARFNKELSNDRAAEVRSYLMKKGIDGSRLRSVGYGAERPLDASNSDAAHEKNRRVEFRIDGSS